MAGGDQQHWIQMSEVASWFQKSEGSLAWSGPIFAVSALLTVKDRESQVRWGSGPARQLPGRTLREPAGNPTLKRSLFPSGMFVNMIMSSRM